MTCTETEKSILIMELQFFVNSETKVRLFESPIFHALPDWS